MTFTETCFERDAGLQTAEQTETCSEFVSDGPENSVGEASVASRPSAQATLQRRACERVSSRSCGVQAEPSVTHQFVQTVATSSLPPKPPGNTSLRGFKAPVSSPRRSGSSRSGSSSPRTPSHCGSIVESGSRSSSDVSLMVGYENDEAVIGGTDSANSAWTRNHTGIWHRSPNEGKLSLNDFLALPVTDNGCRLSFGSLGHATDGHACRPCIHNLKRQGSCRHGPLCFFCHSEHHSRQRWQRKSMRGEGRL